jgi:argininosuccinate lyase
MTDTGRIQTALHEEARSLLFEHHLEPSDPYEARAEELRAMVDVDTAHLTMLADCGIVDTARVATLLETIDRLARSDFDALRRRPAPRGLYLSYESWLSETLGQEVGGVLHSGRSRNDLNATVLYLRLRRPLTQLVWKTLSLGATLIRGGQRYANVVMPAYTHYQPAVPVTYGHYLAALATALNRDIGALLDVGRALQTSPLGAGAVGGTTLPIDPEQTAALLGFDSPPINSIDAVASRDVILRLLSSAAVLGVLLSRAAQDLLLWTSQEFNFLRLPDDLVGSSSMMPQKRNPFLLEHVQGRTAVAPGAFVSAVAAMRSTPFSNSIAVGTEATNHVWPAVAATTDSVALLRLVFRAAEPQADRMVERARTGLTTVTVIAENLVRDGVPFRTAHMRVGAAIRQAEEAASLGRDIAARFDESTDGAPDPVAAVGELRYGGGAGAFDECLAQVRAEWRTHVARARAQNQRWNRAAEQLGQIRSQSRRGRTE